MKRVIALLMVLGLLALAVSAVAGKEKKESKVVTLTGEIVDSGCYIAKGARGADHKTCALNCIAGGMPMGLLTEDGELFVVLMAHGNADPFNAAKKLAAETVEISGPVFERNGVKAIEVDEVKVVEKKK